LILTAAKAARVAFHPCFKKSGLSSSRFKQVIAVKPTQQQFLLAGFDGPNATPRRRLPRLSDVRWGDENDIA
jgi:hypothetical protein